jgi:hypothetical protein
MLSRLERRAGYEVLLLRARWHRPMLGVSFLTVVLTAPVIAVPVLIEAMRANGAGSSSRSGSAGSDVVRAA